ncbi:MAG: hypothetical protein LBQ73_11075 [Tannerellaceae bacterium]|jgi:hypothetical protein|nr:hypothetical protein [Tannerellaceae bacterium]
MKGRIVKYEMDNGGCQLAHLLTDDQSMKYIEKGKVAVRPIDENGGYLKIKNKPIALIKQASELKVIGFID